MCRSHQLHSRNYKTHNLDTHRRSRRMTGCSSSHSRCSCRTCCRCMYFGIGRLFLSRLILGRAWTCHQAAVWVLGLLFFEISLVHLAFACGSKELRAAHPYYLNEYPGFILSSAGGCRKGTRTGSRMAVAVASTRWRF